MQNNNPTKQKETKYSINAKSGAVSSQALDPMQVEHHRSGSQDDEQIANISIDEYGTSFEVSAFNRATGTKARTSLLKRKGRRNLSSLQGNSTLGTDVF